MDRLFIEVTPHLNSDGTGLVELTLDNFHESQVSITDAREIGERLINTANEAERLMNSARQSKIKDEARCQTDREECGRAFFGGCPFCGKADGYRNIGWHHWFFCDTHRTRWWGSQNYFENWRDQTLKDWEENERVLWQDYINVKPVGEWPPKTHTELNLEKIKEAIRLANSDRSAASYLAHRTTGERFDVFDEDASLPLEFLSSDLTNGVTPDLLAVIDALYDTRPTATEIAALLQERFPEVCEQNRPVVFHLGLSSLIESERQKAQSKVFNMDGAHTELADLPY
jgi:hypothetical protein